VSTGFDKGIERMDTWMRQGAAGLALAAMLTACGGGSPPAAEHDADNAGTAATPAAGSSSSDAGAPSPAGPPAPAAAAADAMLVAPDWMPRDWDRNAFRGDAYSRQDFSLQPDLVQRLRQEMQLTTPFTLWAVAHDTLIDERFEPVWVWWTALRSCERGIQMSEDLAGEFGDRARGKAALTAAREDLKAFAATQPPDITLHFLAQLGKWNEATGNFPLVTAVHYRATNLDAREVERRIGDWSTNATEVQLGSDAQGRWVLRQMRAPVDDVACVTADGQKLYRFPRQSQWYVVFGEAERGLGGLVNYRQDAQVPAPNMSREQAAAFSQRNPERKVMVSITFGAGEPGFVVGVDHSAVRGVLRRFVVTDALDGSVLAERGSD